MISLRGKLLIGFFILSVLFCVYAFFDPADTWWMPKCPVKFVSGFDCPGCGSQRAVHALLHGDIAEAWSQNALLIVMIPFLALMGYAEFTRTRHPRLYRVMSRPALIFFILGLMVVWTVYRNLF